MNIESGILLHLGLNYLLAPPPEIDQRKFLQFQNALLDEGIDYGEAKYHGNAVDLSKTNPPLQIKVASPEGRVGQLLIISPHPVDGVDSFARKGDAIISAFMTTWGSERQVAACDCTIRYLYDSSNTHAFAEIWEEHLRQSRESLRAFGAPVGGGGLRFVMPAVAGMPDSAEIDLKIESFLKNPRKIYIDAQFKWVPQRNAPLNFDPSTRLSLVDNFVEERVMAFMKGTS